MPNAGSYIIAKWLSDKIREKIKTSQKKGSQTNLRQINGPELPIKKQRLQKNIKNLESDYAN